MKKFNNIAEAILFLQSDVAKSNGIDVYTVEKGFSVTPAVSQKLQGAILEHSQFLKLIDVRYETQNAGEVVTLASTLNASRTKTGGGKQRQTRNMIGLTNREWRCIKTNHDYHITYEQIDEWRHDPEFMRLFYEAVNAAIVESRLCVAWNGTHAADDTDFEKYPLLQDVNTGWLERLRKENPGNVMGTEAKPVKVGEKEELRNIDAAALSVASIIPVKYRNRKDLVVIVGQSLLDDKDFQVANKAGHVATELLANGDLTAIKRRVGNMTAYAVQYFPENAIFVTPLKNLQLIIQRGSERRSVKDEPAEDMIKTFMSENVTYQIADLEACALMEHIELVAATDPVDTGE